MLIDTQLSLSPCNVTLINHEYVICNKLFYIPEKKTDPDTHSAHEEKNSPESTSFQSPTISSVSKSNTSFLLELPDYFKEKSVQDSFQPSYTKLSPVSMSGESSLHKSANNSLHLNNSHAMKVNHFHYFHAKIPPNIYIHLGNMAHGVLYTLNQGYTVRSLNIDNFLDK